jgi:outer membrane protein OmpA-like peptidoglycan-associated protein
MLETELQEWEEYDARALHEAQPTAYRARGGGLRQAVQEESEQSPFLFRQEGGGEGELEGEGEGESLTLGGGSVPLEVQEGEIGKGQCRCGCGRSATRAMAQGESYANAESSEAFTENLEAFEGEGQSVETEGEGPIRQGQVCAVNCASPPKADTKLIRPKGKPEGAVIERTQGDPSANLALQLFDYDINAYTPTKARHREALVRIREFIVERAARTSENIAVTITGLASRTGTSDYNYVLSCKRAKCAAENIMQSLSFFRGVSDRVQLNVAGEGFTRATCKGSECEQGEWRSVLIQVHGPNRPPRPVPPVDPGWDKYTIRCCSFHTESIVTALLGDLLRKGLPNLPPSLKSKALQAITKGITALVNRLLKQLPRLEGVVQGLGELLELFPAEIIRETGVFELRERDKANIRGQILCYSGFGLRLIFPRKNLDEFLDEAIGKVSVFRNVPDFLKKQLKEAVKKLIPDVLKTVVQPIESNTPGPFVRFDLKHPRRINVFEGSVQVGKGVWMPGQVNVEFDSAPWKRPDPIQRPIIVSCPGTTCNDAGIQTTVGAGQGLELFSVTAGDLLPGSCVCAASELTTQRVARQQRPRVARRALVHREMEGTSEMEQEGEMENAVPEFEGESMYGSEGREARTEESKGEFAGESEGEASLEFDPYAGIRHAMAPEHATLEAGEIAVIFGRTPSTLVLHQMVNSPQLRQATLASLLGKAGRRSIRINGSRVSVPVYLRILSRLCREVAEQSEAEQSTSTH